MSIIERWQAEDQEALEAEFSDQQDLDCPRFDELSPEKPRGTDLSNLQPKPKFADDPIQLEQRGITAGIKPAPDGDSVDRRQFALWNANTIHKNTVAAKLRRGGLGDIADVLEHCHTIPTYALCSGCGRHQKFLNRCDTFICPECAPRRSKDRERAVKWWAARIPQPKHVTLTVKNVPNITKAHVLEFKKWWRNLRGQVIARNWTGGFYTIEITNEGRGWHLHLHALINAVWIDEFALSTAWARTTNGMGRIVKVKSARCASYLKQVTKYLVKGNQLAAWSPNQLVEFYHAFDGTRTFGVFGDLYGARTEFADWWKAVRDKKPACVCGCDQQIIFSSERWLERDLVPNSPTAPRPPPAFVTQPQFSNLEPTLPPR
jgi:hypothetical protein